MLAAFTLGSFATVASHVQVSSLADEAAALRPLVRAVIAAVLGEGREHPDVEDCTHETLRRAFEGQSRLRDGEPLRPWLVGIARHVALDTLRSRRRNLARRAPEGPRDDESAPRIERAADPSPDAFERLAVAERDRTIRRVMDQLPDGPRTALTLFHIEGLSYDAIGRRMGVPLGTVATWVARGRKAMAEALREELT
jgi:RNA polymerase sigma factor (sigma-70 family)